MADSNEGGPSKMCDKVWALRKTRVATTLLKAFSIAGGLFLVVAGIVGLSGIVLGQIAYFVGSIYAIIFGCTVLVVEVRDKVPLVAAAYQFIERYLKFMTLQRGKGAWSTHTQTAPPPPTRNTSTQRGNHA